MRCVCSTCDQILKSSFQSSNYIGKVKMLKFLRVNLGICWFCVSTGILLAIIGESFASPSRLIDPKLDFRSESDQVDRYPELGINHKLYNVRVIVDAARSKQPRNMDAEVFSDVENIGGGSSGKNKKTVGIQTNITIEVSDEEDNNNKNERKDTNSADEDVENASVPVFKGKRVDPNKNRPESKLFFDYSGSREVPVPSVFPKTDEDSFRNLNWYYFQPPSAGFWTTAKPRTEDYNFLPYGIGLRPLPSPTPAPYPDYLRVKPCQCRFHDDAVVRRPNDDFDKPFYRPKSEEVLFTRGRSDSSGIDDKLEYPFHA